MLDLFERETAVLERAARFLDGLNNVPSSYYDEFVTMTLEYECLLRQARLMVRCSDLTAIGLNADKRDLLDKVNIDALTGLYNRRYLEENLQRYHKLLSRTNGCLALLMLDLDFFKNYNDTYGHTAGDVCLQKVASVLHSATGRAEDFAARYGGEEFIVVLSNTCKDGALLIAERILENVRALGIPHSHNAAAPCVTVSIGVTSSKVLYSHNPQRYVEYADAALYHSKKTGRNRMTYVAFGESDS